jgi:hypothetical protein
MAAILPPTVQSTAAKVKRPSISFDLTDSTTNLKASVWAVHLLKSSSREMINPGNLQTDSGFEVTGPFIERSAGLRLELHF